LFGVAVKVTLGPVQIVVEGGAMPTEGATVALTVMVIALDVAVMGDAQAALDVMMALTTSPFINAVVV
jgi:hypothetical protein